MNNHITTILLASASPRRKQLLEQHALEDNDSNWRRLLDAYLVHLPRTLRQRDGQ